MLRIASRTRSRNFGLTAAVWLMTCETVPIETFARSAICRIVTGVFIGSHAAPRPSKESASDNKLAGFTYVDKYKRVQRLCPFCPLYAPSRRVRRRPSIHQNRSESSAKSTHKIIVDKDDGMIICSRNRAEWGRNVFGGSYFETFHS